MLGRLINGRYRLIAPLGEGGMATLWRAVDEQLDREVAVKLLRPQYSTDPGFARRFKQEARSAGSLAHPNIVSVYDYGQDGEDAATQYIVMQLVDGQDLSGLLRERGRLPVADAVRIALGVASALEAAHRRGIVHRDVKPGNILITDDGDVKVTDFGIARAVSETSMTVTGTTLGSVHYFSPEQARGDEVTGASDVYALGIVLYEMLAGRRPFEGDSAAGVALKRLTDDPPPPTEFNADLPPALVAIVMRSLARELADRYPDAGAMAEALRGYQRDPGAVPPAVASGIPAPIPASGSPTVYVPPPVQRPADRAPAMPPPSRREPRYADDYRDDRGGTPWWTWLLGLLGVVLLAAIGFIGAQLLDLGSAEPTPSAPAGFELPNWVGDPITAVRLDAEERGLTLNEVAGSSSEVERDRVISTDPEAGTEVAEGDTITVVVSDGPPETTVPNVTGQTVDQADSSLASANLEVGAIAYQYHPTAPSGTVISTTPGAGESVTEGSSVALVVSQGPEPTPTPSPSPTPVPETPPPTPSPTPVPAPVTP